MLKQFVPNHMDKTFRQKITLCIKNIINQTINVRIIVKYPQCCTYTYVTAN